MCISVSGGVRKVKRYTQVLSCSILFYFFSFEKKREQDDTWIYLSFLFSYLSFFAVWNILKNLSLHLLCLKCACACLGQFSFAWLFFLLLFYISQSAQECWLSFSSRKQMRMFLLEVLWLTKLHLSCLCCGRKRMKHLDGPNWNFQVKLLLPAVVILLPLADTM